VTRHFNFGFRIFSQRILTSSPTIAVAKIAGFAAQNQPFDEMIAPFVNLTPPLALFEQPFVVLMASFVKSKLSSVKMMPPFVVLQAPFVVSVWPFNEMIPLFVKLTLPFVKLSALLGK
jgi:hypothetical protein